MENEDMSEQILQDQAVELEQLMPRVLRRLYTLDPDHPANDLPVAQLKVCTILQAGPRTHSAISEELGISVSATTQIADRLERAGLVERVAGVCDRRTKYLQLAPHGMEMMRTRRETRVQRTRLALAELSPEARLKTLDVIRALLTASIAVTPDWPHGDPAGIRQEQG
jgi:DNA-binding MarR family transcriptional regulator